MIYAIESIMFVMVLFGSPFLFCFGGLVWMKEARDSTEFFCGLGVFLGGIGVATVATDILGFTHIWI